MNIGVYVHLPFCKSRCSYCDFCSQTNLGLEDRCLAAIINEIERIKLMHSPLWTETLYIGGGTPSLIKTENLFWLIYNIFQAFPPSRLRKPPEITIELNPDDVTSGKLNAYKQMGVNRISLGVQTFHDNMLRLLGRRHSAKENLEALEKIREHGFDNLSVDLIIAVPDQTSQQLKADILEAKKFDPEHFSVYCLSYEDGTRLHKLKSVGKINALDEDSQASLYTDANNYLNELEYHQYEISSYCKMSYECCHNLNYWRCGHYVGLGPAAHSHIGDLRWSNLRDVYAYLQAMESGYSPIEMIEELNRGMKAEELLMLALRTRTGLDLKRYQKLTGNDLLKKFPTLIDSFKKDELIEINGNQLKLTFKGFLLADQIILSLLGS
jgi:oxygen-independent coproporphyrinogen-3 oxidase